MDDNLCFYFCDNANLKDYLAMMAVLERKDVDSGFVHFSNSSRICTLGIHMKSDSDEFPCNLLSYPSIPMMVGYQQTASPYQTLDVVTSFKLALLDFRVGDFCQTKKLTDVRASIAKNLGIDIDPSFPCAMSPTLPSTPEATILPSAHNV